MTSMAKKIHVLFVDDELADGHSLEPMFANEPYGILVTGHPDDARETLKRENIKVIVCAQQRPTINGLQFLREVKETSPGTVRIFLAKESEPPLDTRSMTENIVEGSIQKPFKAEALLSFVRLAVRLYDLAAENKKLQTEVKKVNIQYDDQKDITNIVSHELRTPLASIKAAIDLVVKNILGPINQQQSDVLTRAQASIDHLKTLTDEILDLTKLEAKKMKMVMKKDDLNTTIREVANGQRKVADSKGLYLKTKLDESIPFLPFDKQRIVQVINNLLSNALKYTRKGGVMIFSQLDSQNKLILVSVQDTGRGIAEENMPIIFEKFQRIESDDDTVEKGTGLGLPISRAIVQSHNGKIWAESQLGKGTTFHFILPLEQTETTNT